MIQLISTGNLTKDVIVNSVNSKQVLNFTIAHNSKYGEKETVTYIDCAYWNESKKLAEYLRKGQQIVVSGEPSLREWESNGKKGTSLTLRVSNIQLLGSKTEQSQTHTPGASYTRPEPTQEDVENLPF